MILIHVYIISLNKDLEKKKKHLIEMKKRVPSLFISFNVLTHTFRAIL